MSINTHLSVTDTGFSLLQNNKRENLNLQLQNCFQIKSPIEMLGKTPVLHTFWGSHLRDFGQSLFLHEKQ